MNLFNHPLSMLDSQLFIMPALSLGNTSGVDKERLFTLAQIFLEVLDPKISNRWIHAQYYTYNELFLKALASSFGPAKKFFELPLKALMGRLLIIQGFLHSDDSGRIEISLKHPRTGERHGTLDVNGQPSPRAQKVIRDFGWKMTKLWKELRTVHLFPFSKLALPGKSFHSGGSFPMSRTQSGFTSDTWGRPNGFSRLHMVDSSIFPSIPGTTITLTVMANAHRIGSGDFE